MSLRSQNKAVVYNRAGERIEKLTLSLSEAQSEVDRGNAHWLRSKRGAAIQLSQWDRFDPTPSAIPASTMRAYAAGARWARRKVSAWGAMQQANIAALGGAGVKLAAEIVGVLIVAGALLVAVMIIGISGNWDDFE